MPITAFVGKNGSGKTLCMVDRLALPALEAGLPVVSGMTLFKSADDAELPSEERERHPLWVPLYTWRQIPDLEDCTLLLDEISSAFGSRESAKMPPQVASTLQQLRKRNVLVGWTGPSWKRADVVLREVTKEVVLCTGNSPVRSTGSRWPSNRKFRFESFSADDFEEFSVSAAKSTREAGLSPVSKQRYKRQKNKAHLLYDTMEPIGMLDHHDEYGQCAVCGGTRRRPACSCTRPDGPDPDRRRAKRGAGPEAGRPVEAECAGHDEVEAVRQLV